MILVIRWRLFGVSSTRVTVVFGSFPETIDRAAMIVDAHTDVLLELLVHEGDEPSFELVLRRGEAGVFWALLAAEALQQAALASRSVPLYERRRPPY